LLIEHQANFDASKFVN